MLILHKIKYFLYTFKHNLKLIKYFFLYIFISYYNCSKKSIDF
jgi:hypothetical protein